MRGNLPPQAYTREVVANAYNWLQAQPEHIRRMAQNTDSLVALYLRAKRNGETQLNASVVNATVAPQTSDMELPPTAGVESFRSQLKTLASEIQQFTPEIDRVDIATTPPQTNYPPPSQPLPGPNPTISPSAATQGALDPHSLEILRKVRQSLNLGSDMEAMRMLLVLGFDKIQILFRNGGQS